MGAEWQITCWYLAVLLPVALLAKVASLRGAGGRWAADRSFYWAPCLTVSSWQKRKRLSTPGVWRRELLVGLGQLALAVLVYLVVVPPIRSLPWWLQSYLAIVPFWLLLEGLSGLLRLCWLPTGQLVPAINREPWRSANLAEFWGRRWNRLIGDWLQQVIFTPLRRKPRRAMFVTFLVSGLLHELLVSLPLTLVYDENVWGWLTGYFLLQHLAMVGEKRLALSPAGRRLLLWLVVLVPAPLVLNRSTLLIFHLGG